MAWRRAPARSRPLSDRGAGGARARPKDRHLDPETATAYEFKVSGKNAWAEFYKDIVKIIMWNEKRNKKIATLVFITEETFGRAFLNAPMPRAYIDYLAKHGLNVRIEYVRHA